MRPKVALKKGSLTPKAALSWGTRALLHHSRVLDFELTVDIAQVKVPVDKRGPVVKVLGHVVQPVGLHAFDPVVAVLDLQRNL